MKTLIRLLAVAAALAVLVATTSPFSSAEPAPKHAARAKLALAADSTSVHRTNQHPTRRTTARTPQRYSATSVGRAATVHVTPGDNLYVLRLTAADAAATPTTITLHTPAPFLVATTGNGHRTTRQFVASWAADAYAGPLQAVVLTADGVRHSVSIFAPAWTGSELTLRWTAADAVPAGLATESGIGASGGVAGLSGTLPTPTLFVALPAARTVGDCPLTPGAVCDGTNLAQQSLESADLSDASLQHVNLWQAGLRKAVLIGANLSQVGGYRADLSRVSAHGLIAERANFTQASLASADLSSADLRDAVVRRADLSHVDLSHAELREVKAAGVYARDADLSWTDLSRAELIDADLAGADLRGADLHGADLAGANLIGADLTGADLTGANLDGALLRDTAFSGAHWSDTKCPDGLVSSYPCG